MRPARNGDRIWCPNGRHVTTPHRVLGKYKPGHADEMLCVECRHAGGEAIWTGASDALKFVRFSALAKAHKLVERALAASRWTRWVKP